MVWWQDVLRPLRLRSPVVAKPLASLPRKKKRLRRKPRLRLLRLLRLLPRRKPLLRLLRLLPLLPRRKPRPPQPRRLLPQLPPRAALPAMCWTDSRPAIKASSRCCNFRCLRGISRSPLMSRENARYAKD